MKVQCKAILFDMDGTLLDSNEASEITWQIWAQENNVKIEAIRSVHHGRRPEETIALVAPHLNAQESSIWVYDSQREMTRGIHAIPGANKFYQSLPIGTYGIVTAATQDILELRFNIIGITPPLVCVTSKLLKKGKPDPEGYLMGAKLLGVDPQDCLVFEDAPAGLLAAKRAGMKSIAVTTNYTEAQLREELGSDYHCEFSLPNYENLSLDLSNHPSYMEVLYNSFAAK